MSLESRTRELQRIQGEIEERNYARVMFPLTRAQLTAAADAFLDFLELPQETKQQFSFNTQAQGPGTSFGYIRRNITNGGYDNKEFFHYFEGIEQKFPALATVPEQRIRAFMTHAQRTYDAAIATLQCVLDWIIVKEPTIREQYFRDGVRSPQHTLRFLKYDASPEETLIAKGHYDGGGLTLALAESGPGLRICANGTMQPVEHADGIALLMPGITFNEHSQNVKFPKTWHDVVQKGVPTYRPGVGRWAIVLFGDPFDQRRITPEEARTQNP